MMFLSIISVLAILLDEQIMHHTQTNLCLIKSASCYLVIFKLLSGLDHAG